MISLNIDKNKVECNSQLNERSIINTGSIREWYR